jgi:Tetratricopeptide repeat/O-Antigen ligase
VSSLVAEPDATGPARPLATPAPRTSSRLRVNPDLLLACGLAALLVAVAFVARGGAAIDGTTRASIGLTLLGAATTAVAALAAPAGRRLWGGVTLALLGALTVLTAVSISWSIAPDDSWRDANVVLGYFAAFAGTMALARVAADRWTAVVGGVVLAAVVLSGYAVLARVFPSISPLDLYSRLREPFDYWNAVGAMAAMGIPGALWLGARRDGHAALGALAVPALALLLVALLMAEGRGPLLAAAAGCACWFAAVPLRLRGAAVLATAGAGAAAVCVWAFAQKALTTDGTPGTVRASAGHSLGLLLLAMLVVLALAGLALAFAMARSSLSPPGRRRLGTALLVALALVPVAGIGVLAASHRGLTGSISHGWHELTDPNAQQPSNTPGRLTSVGGVRARYWANGFTIWRTARWTGVGADGYATARERIQPDRSIVRHAHGYVPQTLADLGLAGLAVSVALLIAWLAAAARATGVRPRRRWGAWLVALARTRDLATRPARRPPEPVTPERSGLITLAAIAIAFGVHSTVDWTWFVPGVAVTGLVCAAWVAARGPLADPPGRAALPRGRAGWSAARGRIALAAMVVVTGLVAAWTIWQPQRAASADDAALAALDAGRLPQAESRARDALRIDPLSLDARFTLAAIQQRQGRRAVARATLQKAVRQQPANPESWLRLGQLELDQGDARAALAVLRAAVYLDPQAPQVQSAFAQAKQQAGGSG